MLKKLNFGSNPLLDFRVRYNLDINGPDFKSKDQRIRLVKGKNYYVLKTGIKLRFYFQFGLVRPEFQATETEPKIKFCSDFKTEPDLNRDKTDQKPKKPIGFSVGSGWSGFFHP